MSSIVALIPARAGSQRIPGKNIKPLAGHPLIAYTIAAAKQSGIFSEVIVSTNSEATRVIAEEMGAVGLWRKPEHAEDGSPDIEWVNYLFNDLGVIESDAFAILRPTSPFRSAATIQRAWAEFQHSGCDCLRAVQPASINPYKMWWAWKGELSPVLPVHDVPPWHSRPTQTLPVVYQQNASLEMAKCSLVRDRLYPSICAGRVYGFLNPEPEGFDINTPEDWEKAERMIASGAWTLPLI